MSGGVELNEEQKKAVSALGKIIVSASAGSGKTFVMIERLVELILKGADVKKVLAVTFTNRAAAQMKDKLRRALIEKFKSVDGERRARLKSQLNALPMADICTIDAFCARLLRSYFYLVGIDPAFRIVAEDSAEGSVLFSRAMDEVFETAYAEKDADLTLLLSVYFRRKRDVNLKNILRKLYKNLRHSLDYKQFLKTEECNLFELSCKEIFEDLNDRIEFSKRQIDSLWTAFEGDEKIRAIISEQKSFLLPLVGRSGLFSLKEAAGGGTPRISTMPPSKKYEGEAAENYRAVKAVTDEIKEIYDALKSLSDREEEYRRYENAATISKSLKRMLLLFDEKLTQLKKESGLLDYNDLEQYAYEILKDENARENIVKRYEYIFVDEYQDVNEAQERIVKLLSREEVFLVGDAKQAIYAFRGSRSDFFINSKRSFPHSLPLTENFRSAPAILEAVNTVFSRAMTEETAGICYRAEKMRGGSRYGGHDGKVNFYFLPKEKKAPQERGIYDMWSDRDTPLDAEAELIADLIQREEGSEWYDADEQCMKTVRFQDIALLVRENTSEAKNVVRALLRRNIPVISSQKVNVCDFWEARLVIDFLSYLDNPEQDIPLAGALLSRIGGLNEEELLKIRETFPAENNFRTAVKRYSSREDTIALKILTFFKRTEKYRAYMRVESCAEIANRLLFDGLEAEIFAKEDGKARLGRIGRLLAQMQGSVGDFLRRLKASGYQIDYSENAAEDAVRVMTMHASKGLEFPVVFLINLDTPFRGSERDEVMYSEKFSFAPKSYDLSSGVVYENVLRRATALCSDREERKGGLNLLYVAMTRAKYRLHLIFKKVEKKSPLRANRLSDFVDFSDCAAYFRDADADFDAAETERQEIVYRPDPKIMDEIRQVYQKKYPAAARTLLPLKTSATRVMEEEKREKAFEYALHNLPEKEDFIGEGLAFHAFLQHADFSKGAAAELSRMQREELLSKEQVALIDVSALEKILSLPAIQEMREKTLFREQRFLAMLPASDIYPTDIKDEILVQGAIDALYQSEEGWTILDYKYSSLERDEIKKKYSSQVLLYKKAVARALKIDEATIRTKIINIRRCEEIEIDKIGQDPTE